MLRLIGLSGRKGSGKSTAGQALCEGLGMKELAFADPLKRGLQQLFGLESDQLWGARKNDVDERWGVTPRQLLQYVGTDVFREALPRRFGWGGEDARASPWVFHMEHELRRHWAEDPQRVIVITDVRFADEVALIRRYGGVIWHVDRPQTEVDAHVSEGDNEVLADRVLRNHGSKEDFVQKVLLAHAEETRTRRNFMS